MQKIPALKAIAAYVQPMSQVWRAVCYTIAVRLEHFLLTSYR